jgi:predicted esterase
VTLEPRTTAATAATAGAGVKVSRRAVLAGLPAAVVDDRGFDVEEIPVALGRGLGKSVLVAVPRGSAAAGSLPLLVLLHGLGETHDERAGLFAWIGPYGLSRAWERLQHPPVTRERESYLAQAELDALNQSLAARPFEGSIVVCPYMPNPYSGGASGNRLERYAKALEQEILPAVRERVSAASREPAHTGIAGVSLGGAVALEVFVRKPRLFATLGTVQGAYGVNLGALFARRIVEAEPVPGRAVYVSTSHADPYRAANERLARELEQRGMPTRLSVRKGPHSQAWLIEIGSLELLLWHDRALRGAVETGRVGAS